MKKNNKRYIAFLIVLLLIFSGCGKKTAQQEEATAIEPAGQPAAMPTEEPAAEPAAENVSEPDTEPEIEQTEESFDICVREFNKRGNVILETTFEELKEKNIELADIITVTIGDQVYDFPVGTSYSDVDSGAMICRFDVEDAKVTLAINGGSFAETTNMAVKETIEEDPGYRWNVRTDTVSFILKSKGGYLDEYTIRNLERTNEREDYSELSDAGFANCRVISTTGMKAGTVYRGTTPLDADMGRDVYAMDFLKENGIKSVLNLADSVHDMTAFETYSGSYYASCSTWNAEMEYNFTSEAFGKKVRDCVAFMIENEAPFYIHCKEGKDRTGIFCAILECFTGASYEEVKTDYMQTYINFYHVEESSETYQRILRTNFEKILCELFEVSDLNQADLKAKAEDYLISTGLTEENLTALTLKIGE